MFSEKKWAGWEFVVATSRICCCICCLLTLNLIPKSWRRSSFDAATWRKKLSQVWGKKHTSSRRSWPAWPIIWKDRNWENLGFKLTGATTKQFNKQHAAASRSPKTHHENIHATFCDEWRSRKKYLPNLVPYLVMLGSPTRHHPLNKLDAVKNSDASPIIRFHILFLFKHAP